MLHFYYIARVKKTPGAYCVWLSAENTEDLVFVVVHFFMPLFVVIFVFL
jgi:hypothetical protein